MHFNDEQKAKLLICLERYNEDPNVFNLGETYPFKIFDKKRTDALPVLRKMIKDFLDKKISLKDFKEQSEIYCREYPYWGFKGYSGQMQLSLYTNNIADESKEKYLREAITLPTSHDDAKNKINNFTDYIQKIRDKSTSSRGLPWSYQNYLLSYFWEIQNHHLWISHYRSLRTFFTKEGFSTDKLPTNGEAYIEFLNLVENIKAFFFDQGHRDEENPYWLIEHVLWKYLNAEDNVLIEEEGEAEIPSTSHGDWLPLIVSDLGELALNKPTKWTEENNLIPQKAFETKLSYAFRLLGYETKELGQGTGREPDGFAISSGVEGGDYAIIYDAKARGDKFRLGTSDREIYEYINKKKRELRRQRINKLYYAIISSNFDENDFSKLRDIYRRTSVPITFLKAEDLLLIIETKLQNVEIDHSQLEYLFLDHGLITRDKIIEELGGSLIA